MVESGYITWPGGEQVRAGMRYRIAGGPHAGGIAEATGEATPGGLVLVRWPDDSVTGMRPAFFVEAVRASAERELDAAGITSDAGTRGVLVARIMRGETTAGEIAAVLDGRVVCSRCGDELEPELLARLADDTDFHEHGDRGHLAAFEPTPANFAAARRAQAAR